ncbi:SCO family protein [Paludibacterium paludis]|uniref:Protein SCO1/2 n=1 Tax=Paludibacterium paludis TaxID=1225769 RepID=A0A918P6N7_9NEIS|nr:SCO family protein [Paludibacterium paludis]GGY23315.1 hypothetical protein GCM10011289_28880 [Paludibacterium paludis]
MRDSEGTGPIPAETVFHQWVEELGGMGEARALMALLREDHPVYRQRGAAAVARMRAWVLLALGRNGLPDAAMPFVLEELETGKEAYPVAVAARVLRQGRVARAPLAAFVVRALENIRTHDAFVRLERYGGVPAPGEPCTTAVEELLAALRWLGPAAAGQPGVHTVLAATREGLAGARKSAVDVTETLLRAVGPDPSACCALPPALTENRRWPRIGRRPARGAVAAVLFEDQDGRRQTFAEVFRGKPSIVAFFYTRCDNPRKCSLTVAKLARAQALLAGRGLAGAVRTAAVTYDPAFDLPDRLRGYAQARGMRLDDEHRVLRAVSGMADLAGFFHLGAGFIGSLVNRHRVEVFVLDAEGRIAASFTRVAWDEAVVAGQAAALLKAPVPWRIWTRCAAIGLSAAGIGVIGAMPGLPWRWSLLPVFAAVNLGALWSVRGRSGRMAGFGVALAGALALFGLGAAFDRTSALLPGIALMTLGSVLEVTNGVWRRVGPPSPSLPAGTEPT